MKTYFFKTIIIWIFLISPFALFANTLAPCPTNLGVTTIAKIYSKGKASQEKFINQLKVCLFSDKDAQAKIDTSTVRLLQYTPGLASLSKSGRKSMVDFCLAILKLNAEAGDADSQFNYGVLHNAKPGSLLFKTVQQSHAIFAYWTKKAAAQGQGSALFNLAVRMASKNSNEDIAYNPKTAYVIFTYLERTIVNNSLFKAEALSRISNYRKNLTRQLGEAEVRQLDLQVNHFSFSSLAPKD